MSNLPERINVMRVVTYNTAEVVKDLHEETGVNPEDITLDEVLDRIEEWAADDLGDTSDLIYQDENGNDL